MVVPAVQGPGDAPGQDVGRVAVSGVGGVGQGLDGRRRPLPVVAVVDGLQGVVYRVAEILAH